MKNQYKLISGFAALIILAAAVSAEIHTGAARRALFNSKSSGEYNHFLPCSRLPTKAEVERTLREHRDVLDKIKHIRVEYSESSGKVVELESDMSMISFGNGEIYEKHSDSVGELSFQAPVISEKCPGKADIYITFGGVSDSVKIRQIIGGDTFFGIPYRMRNI